MRDTSVKKLTAAAEAWLEVEKARNALTEANSRLNRAIEDFQTAEEPRHFGTNKDTRPPLHVPIVVTACGHPVAVTLDYEYNRYGLKFSKAVVA